MFMKTASKSEKIMVYSSFFITALIALYLGNYQFNRIDKRDELLAISIKNKKPIQCKVNGRMVVFKDYKIDKNYLIENVYNIHFVLSSCEAVMGEKTKER